MRAIISLTFIICFVPSIACAEGSVDFDKDIVPILNTRPQFSHFVRANFKILGDPSGIRIDSHAIPALGGARTGPYRVNAVWSDSGIGIKITLIINTRIRYYDKLDREITSSNLRKAVRFVESLDSIEIEPPCN